MLFAAVNIVRLVISLMWSASDPPSILFPFPHIIMNQKCLNVYLYILVDYIYGWFMVDLLWQSFITGSESASSHYTLHSRDMVEWAM